MSLSKCKLKHIKHGVHCLCFYLVIFAFQSFVIFSNSTNTVEPWEYYGKTITILYYCVRVAPLLTLPYMFFSLCGLTFYNAFPDEVNCDISTLTLPMICVRIVTRGDCPNLVRNNVKKNFETCVSAGLKNFMIEVVTQKEIGIEKKENVREIVVPANYKTKHGTLFKARNLQFCLENDVNVLKDKDWILHLDEDSVLTESAVRGVAMFVQQDKHKFGHGFILYTKLGIQSWISTFADFYMVGCFMGIWRMQHKFFHGILFGWSGSFNVANVAAEKDVSFDYGPASSITEDFFFSHKAFAKGYTFGFVEGEILETSAQNLYDLFQQRKRWLQGIIWVILSLHIPIRYKFILAITIFATIAIPFGQVSSYVFNIYTPLLNSVGYFIFSIAVFMHIYGFIKSFRVNETGVCKYILIFIAFAVTFPFVVLLETTAIVWAVLTFLFESYNFYVVPKEEMKLEIQPSVIV